MTPLKPTTPKPPNIVGIRETVLKGPIPPLAVGKSVHLEEFGVIKPGDVFWYGTEPTVVTDISLSSPAAFSQVRVFSQRQGKFTDITAESIAEYSQRGDKPATHYPEVLIPADSNFNPNREKSPTPPKPHF